MDVKKEGVEEIVSTYIKPIQDSLLQIEAELNELQKNELYRIKIDLNQNKNFYDKMKEFDAC